MERLDRGAAPKRRPRTLPIQVPPKAIEAQYAKALVSYVIAAMRWAYGPLLREAPKLARARAVARHDAADVVVFAGLPIVIENPAGSFRHWVDATGRCGQTVMKFPYGYVAGVRGADGDEVDVFLGPDEHAQWVYIIHQLHAPAFVEFDEDKVMLGFDSADAARAAYLAHYDNPRYFGGMTQVAADAFGRAVAAAKGHKITHVDSYDPSEPRDENGKWSAEGAYGKGVVESTGSIEPRVRAEPEPLSKSEYWSAHDAVGNSFTNDEREALGSWTSASYKGINSAARGGESDKYPTVRRLDTAIAKSKAPRDLVVFRGLNEDRTLGFKPGDTFSDRGFIATSARRDVAEDFARSSGEAHSGYENGGSLVKIIVPKGSHALPVVGEAGDEGEVLLPRNSHFKVLQVVHSGSGENDRMTVTAQLLDEGHRDGADDRQLTVVGDSGRFVWSASDIVRHAVTRYDSPESRRVQKLIREAARRLRLKLNKREIARLAKKFAERTSTYQRMQLHNQVHAVLGIAAPLAAEYTQSRIADFVRENVALITRIPQEFHGDVEVMVHHAVTSGQLSEDLAEDLEDRFAISERRARFIARDQISKLQGDLNHARQKDLGVQRFVWRTMRDERVRGAPGGLYPNAEPSHFDLEGREFAYDDPPQPPGADGPILPGDDYNCRCYAEPILDDLSEDIRSGETPEDEAELD